MWDVLFWGGGIVAFLVIGCLIAAKRIREKRRQYELIAPQLGFKVNPERSGYLESAPRELLDGFRRLPMSKYRTHSKSFSFILIREEPGRRIYIFDFWERKHASVKAPAIKFTVCMMVSDHCRLPRFALWPRSQELFPRPLAAPEIEVADGGINRSNILNGDDEEAIRELFSRPGIAAFFRRESRLLVEGNENTLACYRWMKTLSPRELPAFYAEAQEIFSRFDGNHKV
jgi:hypothetical protein